MQQIVDGVVSQSAAATVSRRRMDNAATVAESVVVNVTVAAAGVQTVSSWTNAVYIIATDHRTNL